MATIGNEYLYTGRRLDPETGLQYSRFRFYHQQLGRWINRDPSEYHGSPFNLYEYANSAPLDELDPTGLLSLSGIASAIGPVSAGTCKSYPIGHLPLPYGFSLNLTATICGETLKCCKDGQLHLFVGGTFTVDAYGAWGKAIGKKAPRAEFKRKPKPKGRGDNVHRRLERQRLERVRRQNRKIEREDIPNTPAEPGFAQRTQNYDFGVPQACPKEGVAIARVEMFFRGTAGAGVGVQFDVTAPIYDSSQGFLDPREGISARGSVAWWVAGVSLEAGVSGSGEYWKDSGSLGVPCGCTQ